MTGAERSAWIDWLREARVDLEAFRSGPAMEKVEERLAALLQVDAGRREVGNRA